MISRSLVGHLALFFLLWAGGSLASADTLSAQDRPVAAVDSAGPEISPRGALLRSFAVPGWGQTYAQAPGRGAIYFGLEAVSLWMVYKTSRQLAAARARDRWARGQNDTPDEDEPPTSLTLSRSQQFEDWVTLAISVALFSGADAYVTAQLSDFAEQVQVRPGAGNSLEIGVTLPVGSGR
jgi:hypothetical protein